MIVHIDGNVNRYYVQMLCMVFFPGSTFGEEEEGMDNEDYGMASSRGGDLADDPIYIEAMQFVMENGKVSISLLQRRFRIGFNRAARFVEQMEKDGILGQADGTKPRTVNR